MNESYVISMSVISGDPLGLILVDKSGWVGRVISLPRNYSGQLDRCGLDSPGVYFLIGDSESEFSKPLLYIGEAEKISDRLATHQGDQEKDFWTKTIVFVSKDKTLNKADVKYMESELIEIARSVNTWKVTNKKSSLRSSLSGPDEIKTKGFLTTLKQILPLMGLNAFVMPEVVGGKTFSVSGPSCSAKGEDQAGGFLVLKDSLARKQVTASFPSGYKAIRAGLIDDGLFEDEGDSFRLNSNYLFTSGSTAASVFLGRSANGRSEWKDELGKSLGEVQVQK